MAGGHSHFLVVICMIWWLLCVKAANIASGKTATLSSLAPHWNRAASLAVDGNTNTDFYAGSCVATAEEKDPWLRVDLGKNYLVTSVKLYLLSTDLFYVYFDQVEYPQSGVNLGSGKTFDECLELCRQDTENNCRQFVRRNWARDNCYRVTTGRKYRTGGDTYTQNKGRALANLKISVSNTVSGPKSACKTVVGPIQSSSAPYTCTQPVSGRYVWLTVDGDNRILALCEVEVDGDFSYMANDPTYKHVTSHGFTVEWAACQFAESSQSTNRYKVEHTKKGSGTWYSYDVTGTSTTFTGRQHNTQYIVRVRCYWKDENNDLQLADAYKEITIKTLCKDPVQVTIDAVTPTLAGHKQNPIARVALAWKPISNTDSGCDQITRYDVQYSKTGSSAWTTASPSGGISSSTAVYTITDLEFNTQYKVRVKATNNDGKSSLGAEREATTKEGLSSAVRSLQQIAQSHSLHVAWQPPAHPRGIITVYKVSYQLRQRGTCSNVDGEWSDVKLVTSLYHDLTGLYPYSEYRVRVVPVNGAGDGVEATMDWRTAATAPFSPPQHVRINAKTARSVTFEWTGVSCNKINGAWIQYRHTLQGTEYDNRTWAGTSHDVTWTARDLVPYALYSFTVTAVNNAGSSAQSEVIQVRTDQAAPRDVTVLESRQDALIVTWRPPTPPHGVLLKYQLRYGIIGHGALTYNIVNETKVFMSGLRALSYYSVQVRGSTKDGWGSWSVMTYGFTQEGVPREPIQFSLTSRSTDFMVFAWGEPTIKNGYILGYKVTCEDAITGILYSDETNDLFVKISNLLPGHKYRCAVAARTKKGYGGNSTALSGWTKPIAPRPMEPRFEQATDTTLTFELPPAQPGVTRYQLVVDTVGGSSFDDRRKRQTASAVGKLTGCSGDVNKDDVYITAELLSNHVSQRFTVGDDQTYGRYRNCPLYKGRQYDIHYGSVIESEGGDIAVSFIKINGTFKAVAFAEESAHDLWIAIGCACAGVITIAVVILGVLCYRRRNSTVTSSSKWWKRKQSGQNANEEPNYVNAAVCFHAIEDNDGYEDLHGFSKEESPVYAEIKQDYVTSSPAREPSQAPERKMFSLVDDLNAKINRKKAANNRLFNQEFQRITAKTENNLVGRKKENISKNRHGVHITYDHSRVVLLSGEDDSNSDYINASHIKNYQEEDCYIVTQVPLHHTFCDFWRMVWQEQVAFIVIIGGQHQDDFDQFWPETNSLFTYDDIRITTIKDDQEKNCIITTIQTTKEGESRNFFLMQFGAGESMGYDHEHIKSFLGYKDMFEKLNTIRRPTIVIDSGINDVSSPPGIFIALNLLLVEAEAGKRIDVGLCVQKMLYQRAGMINTLEEYIFLHDLLHAAIQADVTAVPVSTFLGYYETICHVAPDTHMSQLNHQFQIARGTVDTDDNREFGKTQTIKDSIRDDAFVIMNVSMTDSSAGIWTTMDDHGSRTLVTFTNSSDSEKVGKRISPNDSSTPLNLKKFKISLLKNESDDGIVNVQKLEVSKRFQKSATVTKIVDVKDWPDNDSIFDTTKSIVALLYVIDPWLRQTDGAPITVICRSGMESRCGTFVALVQILKKLKSEEKVDVFGVVKRMIRHHPQCELNEMQFRFCYDVIAAYVRTLHV